MGSALNKRKKIGSYFSNLLTMKLSGRITQEELEQRLARTTAEEQLSLGIGASTEPPRRSAA
jgi:hypothetical protein